MSENSNTNVNPSANVSDLRVHDPSGRRTVTNKKRKKRYDRHDFIMHEDPFTGHIWRRTGLY